MRLFTLFNLITLASALPYVVHERRSDRASFSSLWTLSPPETLNKPNHVLPLRFGLKQQNIEKLHDELMRVSDPSSEHYSKHWTPQEVREFFKPEDDSINAVKGWLAAEGFDARRIKVSNTGGWIEMPATVHEAERLLKTNYGHYTHINGAQYIGCAYYSVPPHVSPHIDIILPTVHFDARPPSKVKRADTAPTPSVTPGAAGHIGQPGHSVAEPKVGPLGLRGQFQSVIHDLLNCQKITTLACIRALYSVGFYQPISPTKNSYGIVEYSPQAYLPADRDFFLKNYTSSAVGTRPILKSIDGGVPQTDQQGFAYNGESNLDLQYAIGLVHPQPVTLFQVGPQDGTGSFNTFLDALDGSYCTADGGNDPTQDPIPTDCGTVTATNVVSTSYGYNEADLTPFYEARQCNEYGKLGLLGTTFLFSSGDYGVAGNGGQCLTPDGTYSTGPDGTVFNPSFPGGCPYVTSVGATQLPPGHNVLQAETANYDVIYSGGGFSNNFALPKYQSTAVANYFKSHKPVYTAAQYNNSMTTRGFPDLSANGANYAVAFNGSFGLVYGTSASAPVVGSILTFINDARLAIGKKSIGFINPTIYSPLFQGAFNDITNGTNPGCGTQGFSAVPGWDPVTGLGTPNFAGLLPLWLALP